MAHRHFRAAALPCYSPVPNQPCASPLQAQLQETERRAADMHFANTRLELQLRHQQQQLQQPTGMHTPPPLLALGSMPRSTRSSVMGHMGGALGAAPALPPLERATSFRAAPKLYRALTLPCPPWSVATSTWSQEGVGVMRQAAPLSPSPSACVPTCGKPHLWEGDVFHSCEVWSMGPQTLLESVSCQQHTADWLPLGGGNK